MAEIPWPVPDAYSKCGSIGADKPNNSDGNAIVTCCNCHKNGGIEMLNGHLLSHQVAG